MGSVFDSFRGLGPAGFVLKAVVSVIVADAMLLSFILFRRFYRRRYFARRDARVFAIRQQWEDIISGKIPYADWRTKASDRQLIEAMVLDGLEIASPKESARLLKFLRDSGLVANRILEARHHRGWRRHQALVALGRTHAPEGIPALAEGLHVDDLQIRLAALRGLGQMACPQAARQILSWIDEAGVVVPALPLQSALIQTCAECPQMLLPHLQNPERAVRELLGRVLAEVIAPSIVEDLLRFADDPLPELRAAAARGLVYLKPAAAVEVLRELAQDPIWFVRLRAVVSLGKLRHPAATLPLLKGLTDSNRLVRLRAAGGLVDSKAELAQIFGRVVALHDQYGLHAFLTAIENAGLRDTLEAQIQALPKSGQPPAATLLQVLCTANLPVEASTFLEESRVAAANS
jgi:HEAT repeat protein